MNRSIAARQGFALLLVRCSMYDLTLLLVLYVRAFEVTTAYQLNKAYKFEIQHKHREGGCLLIAPDTQVHLVR